MWKIVGVIAIGLIVSAGYPTFASEVDPKLRGKIVQLMEITEANKLGQQMASGMIEQMTMVMKQVAPDMPSRGFDIVSEVTREILAEHSQQLDEQVIPLYAKYLDEQDIDALIGFYSTPTGRKVIETMPALMQESMQIGGQWAQQLMPQLQSTIQQRLIDEGLIAQ